MLRASLRVFCAVLVLLLVQAVFCAGYELLYFQSGAPIASVQNDHIRRLLVLLMMLAAPLFYYVAGRLFNGRASKKAYLIVTWSLFGLLSLFGVAAIFLPQLMPVYIRLNGPSYLYYQLFQNGVLYLAVPAMLISGLFPAAFSRMGFLHKARQNNEIKMEEVQQKKDQPKSL